MPDASVDVVFGIAILHHLDLPQAAREVWRILKPGGRAIFQEPVRNLEAHPVDQELDPVPGARRLAVRATTTDSSWRNSGRGSRAGGRSRSCW